MATHSSTLAWRIPWTEEPGRLHSMGSHRVGHDWSDLVVVVHLIDYSINVTLYALGRRKIGVTHFIPIFTLLWWSGTKRTSLKSACMSEPSSVPCSNRLTIRLWLWFRTQSAPPVLTMFLKLVCPRWYKLALFIVLSRTSQVAQS